MRFTAGRAGVTAFVRAGAVTAGTETVESISVAAANRGVEVAHA